MCAMRSRSSTTASSSSTIPSRTWKSASPATATSVDLAFLRPVSDTDLSTQVASVPGVSAVTRVDPQHATVMIAGGPPAQAAVLERLVGARLGLVSFEPSRSALEEVYLQEISKGES